MSGITTVPYKGPIGPASQPYTAARHQDGKFVLLKPVEVNLTPTTSFVIEGLYLYGGAKQFVFDGVSIPRPLWSIVGTELGGRCRLAGLVHDFLYQHCGKTWILHGETRAYFTWFSRRQCDQIFYDLLLRAGMPRFRAWLMYRAVRGIGGRLAWKNHAKRITKAK